MQTGLKAKKIQKLYQQEAKQVKKKFRLLALGILALVLLSLLIRTTAIGVVSPIETFINLKTWVHLRMAEFFNWPYYLKRFSILAELPTYSDSVSRLKITIITFVSGMLLALSGTIFQSVFRNPIAAPTMLGVSTGVHVPPGSASSHRKTALNYLVESIINWGVLAIIIIFQPEIRTLLEKMGQTKMTLKKEISDDEKERLMDELVSAITTLSKEQTGALITFERTQSLLDYINTGTRINADIKSELFLTIFWEGTPLHDGATIIQGDRVVCAAAFYPPTNKELSPKYGARHRAAIGISEITDSLTVVVSEETGTISFAMNGELKKIPTKELRASLVNELNWFKSDDEGGQKHES